MIKNKRIDTHDKFIKFLYENETWLMERILLYAKEHDYVKYTSTLLEAWRISIVGLTESLDLLINSSPEIPEMSPDKTFSDDPASAFGIKEAVLHRSRGVNLAMFFSLFKYYRQSYIDLLIQEKKSIPNLEFYTQYIHRFFDHVETAYITEWAGRDAEGHIHELSDKNRELANEKNLYLTLFDSMNNPAILIDKQGTVKNYNLIAGKIFFNDFTSGGYYYNKREEINIDVLFPLNTIEESENVEWSFQDIKFIFTSKPLHDVSGKFVGTILIFNDITKLKEKDELIMVQSRYVAMGEMIGMIAHQWRQPLSSIVMDGNNILVDIELDTLRNEELKGTINSILEQTKHLTSTIDDFRNFFHPKTEKELVLVNDILDDTRKIISSELVNKNIDLKIQNNSKTPLNIYKRELVQVFVNILNNAKDALLASSKNEKEINIQIQEEENNIVVKIEDNAGGIDTSIINKIFDPYFTTKENLNGTGLGLHMSKIIIEEHIRGSISARNEKDGACFEIVLPKNK